jgi:aryl-alcohol dehydrogenase-like predicted oxidoreductase
MEHRTLDRADADLSPLCLGTMNFGEPAVRPVRDAGDDEIKRILRAWRTSHAPFLWKSI